MDRIYAITKFGRKISGDISGAPSDAREVLLYLHEMGSARVGDIAAGTGLSRGKVSSLLGQLRAKGMAEEITRSERRLDA